LNQGTHTHEARISVWDHPESRIAYLESVMNGADWRACVYAPPHANNAENTLIELGSALQKRGYETQLKIDEHGNHALHIHHFNDRPKFLEAIHDMGFAKGIGYGISHPNEALSNLYQGAKEGVGYTTANTARLLAGLYLLGDVVLTPTEWFDKHKKSATAEVVAPELKTVSTDIKAATKLPARLASFYGPLAILQSVIYMAYAKDGHEKQQQDLDDAFSKGMQSGYKHLDINQWHNPQNEEAFEPDSMFGKVQNMMKNHPIEAGAIAQIVAGYSVAGANLLAFKNIRALQNGGGHKTVEAAKELAEQASSKLTYAAFGGLTGTSWAILPTANRAEGEEKTSVFHHITDNPAKISATFSTAGSLFGLKSAMTDKNKAKYAGQGLYLLGDATMFLLKSTEYGKKGAGMESLMIEAASHFMQHSPMIMGDGEQLEFSQHLSRYMVQQLDEVEKSDMPEMIKNVSKGIVEQMKDMPDKTDAFISRLTSLIETFPDNKREQVSQSLSESVASLPGVFIEASVLHNAIAEKIDHMPNRNSSDKTPSMHDLAPHITKVLSQLPPMQAANNANILYETLAPHMRTTAHDETVFAKNMMDYSAEVSGIPPHIIKSQLSTPSLPNRNM